MKKKIGVNSLFSMPPHADRLRSNRSKFQKDPGFRFEPDYGLPKMGPMADEKVREYFSPRPWRPSTM